MDVSKYKEGMELVSSSEENGVLTQEFYNPIHHVKYNRVAWGGSNIKDEDIKLIKELCSSSVKFLSEVLPNAARLEIGDSYMESLYFEDDDTVFNSKVKLHGLLYKLGLKKRLTVMNLVDNETDYYNAVNELTSNEEYINLLKEIYKNYLNKEL